MLINVKKFGTTLISRPAGKEAYLAFKTNLGAITSEEDLMVDFDGVITLTPSWADEFLSPIFSQFGGRVKLINTSNASVRETLKILKLT